MFNLILNKSNLTIHIIAFLIMITPLVGAILGTQYQFVLISLSIIYLLYDYIKRKGRLHYLMYIPFILLMVMFVYSLSTFSTKIIYHTANSIFYFIAAYWLFKQDKIFLQKMSFVTLVIFYIYFLGAGLYYGFTPWNINHYFVGGSKNYVSAMAIFLQIFYSISYYRSKRKLPMVTVVITLVICVITAGRSGIGLSAMIVLFSSYFMLFHGNRTIKISIFITALLVFIMVFVNLDTINEILILNTNLNQGMESSRFLANQSYFDNLSIGNLILGIDFSTLSVYQEIDMEVNPHNTYILAHSRFGLAYLFFILFFILSSLYIFIFYKNTLVYIIFLIIYSVRIYFDVLITNEMILYFIFLSLLEVSKTSRLRAIFRVILKLNKEIKI